MKFDLGIRCDWAVPMKEGQATVFENYFVGIHQGQITEAAPFKPKHKSNSKKFLSKPGMVVIPGLINGHTHLPMTLFRGIEDDSDLSVWLFERIIPLELKFVSPEFCKLGMELAALECLRFGTTTVSDMYFFPEIALKIWDQAGLRGIFSQAFVDSEIPEDKHLGPDREARFRKLFAKYANHPRLQMGIAPHAPYSCSDDLLKKISALSQETRARIHIHLSETALEVENSIKDHQLRPTHRLEKLGVLGPRTSCAHSVHIDPEEIQILARTGTSVIYNPDSNSKLSSGTAPIPSYFKSGIPVGLGTDGSASANDLSLFGAMDLGVKMQKLFHRSPTALTAEQILSTATWNGARALGLESQVGSIEVGKKADLTIVDFKFPHLQPVNSVLSNLVYSTHGSEVDTVLCEGQILLENKKFKKLKPEPIYKKAEALRKKMKAHLDSRGT